MSADAATPAAGRRAVARPRRSGAVVLVVAVLAGLALGRFLLAGPDAPPPVATSRVAPAADLAGRVAQLERAVQGDPRDLSSLQQLGVAYVERASETGDPAFYGLADTALSRADALAPGAPDTLLAQGLLALARHEFADALRLGEAARAQRPDSAAVLGVVVDGHVELGQYDAAATALQAMLDLRPDLPALARASYLRELHGDRTGALAAMQQAQAAGSSSPYSTAVVTTLLGDLLLQGGDVAAAGEQYAAALRASPELVGARVGAARVQAAQGDTAGAVAALQDQVQRHPSVAALTLLAELQARAGDTAGASATAQVVRSVAQLQVAAGQVVDLEMALFEADQGDGAAALAHARAAEAARPDNVFVADAVAWATLRSGDAAGAVPYAEQAVRLGTTDPLPHFHAAEVFAAAGQDDRARAELRQVAASPWFSFAHLRDAGQLAARLGVPSPPAWG